MFVLRTLPDRELSALTSAVRQLDASLELSRVRLAEYLTPEQRDHLETLHQQAASILPELQHLRVSLAKQEG